MSSASSPTLICDVHSRRAERWVAWLALACSAAVPFLISTPAPAAVGALLGASVLLAWTGLRRAGWIGGGPRILALSWLHDGRWLLIDDRNESIEGILRADSRAGSGWAWLRWDTNDRRRRRHSMLLVAGDLPSPQLRRLIVRLRIEAASPGLNGFAGRRRERLTSGIRGP